MDNQPLVSIITPSYNQGQFIEETMLSVRGQDYPHIEHIVIDGNSTDTTLEVLKKHEKTYNLHWTSEPDKGQVDAINKGFAKARGEILCWLNSDDVYVTPTAISQMVTLFQEYPQADVVTGGGVIIDESRKWVRLTDFTPAHVSYMSLCYRNNILQPATFFRNYVIGKVPLDTTLHYTFDWDFWIRLSEHYNILVVDRTWAGYRWWGANKTASGISARTREQAEVVQRYLGKNSWQYWLLLVYYWLYKGFEMLPPGVERWLKSALRATSRTISLLTRNRVPVA